MSQQLSYRSVLLKYLLGAISAAAALTVNPTAAMDVAGVELEYNTNREGADYTRLHVQDAEQCARKCADDQRCQAFSYAQNNGKCWLKDNEQQPRYQEGIVSGVKRYYPGDSWSDNRAVEGIRINYDTNRVGGDYRKIRANSAEQCAEECAGEDRCRAFAYDMSNGKCWLKERAVAPIYQDGIVSGVKRRNPTTEVPRGNGGGRKVPKEIAGIKLFDNQRRMGNDYRVFNSGTMQLCAHKCADDSRCQVFTFEKDRGDCHLKGAVPGSRHDWNAISGVKKQKGGYEWPREIGNIDIYYDVNRPGHEYKRFNSGSLQGCAQACGNEQECDAFNYEKDRGVCRLKNRVPKGKRDTSMISGVKKGR